MIAERVSNPASLVVFSDDWGRHPSSCQHLTRQLLPRYRVLWVNTIGTRAPRLDMATVKRVGEKLRQWGSRSSDQSSPEQSSPEQSSPEQSKSHHNLTVVNPRMWPWFSHSHDRSLNSWLLSRQLRPLIKSLPQPVAAITTLPITADLPGLLPVDKWIYYCVDDFGEWPGLDGKTLRRMDVRMTERADNIVAVSKHLQRLIAQQERTSTLLTHGVDLDHWQAPSASQDISDIVADTVRRPLAVFWGVVDRRLNSEMIISLSQRMETGSILLAGPQQDPDERLLRLPNVHAPGPIPFERLPDLAQSASVLIMPYADLPVTQAMQPLKMKEYLATGRPVVVSRLPAVSDWSDCMDVVDTASEFADAVLTRISEDLPASQQNARDRLNHEGWKSKAQQFEKSFVCCSNTAPQNESATQI